MIKLCDVLCDKGQTVHSIRSSANLQDAVDRMIQNDCGSLLVVDNDQLRGIITERDILRSTALLNRPLVASRVADSMSVELLVGAPDDTLIDAMGWMTDNRVRHLPVIQQGRLLGIVSIGDLVKAQRNQLSVENEYLKNYIQS